MFHTCDSSGRVVYSDDERTFHCGLSCKVVYTVQLLCQLLVVDTVISTVSTLKFS